MISGNVEGIGFGTLNDGAMQMAIEVMKTLNTNSPLGKIEISGNDFYYTVMETDVHPLSEIKFEMHKKYIDIHYLIRGIEAIGVYNGKRLGITVPYVEESDCAFCKDGDIMSTIVLEKGDFCIIFPYEAHKPSGMWKEFGKIKKAVFKIKI